MADQKRTARSKVRATALRGYSARLREMSDAFNLRPDTREWVTVRYDPDAPEGSEPFAVSVCATAGHTTTVLPLEMDAKGEVGRALAKLLDECRDELHAQLKLDLATNMMAQSALMEGDDE